ncbi:conserved hypothetical protein, HNE_0200 family [Nannocystis exedens]|uniref:Cytochrome c domain-containing protein n=1 Tax=Nannocystis exedens TaxID=54 RepID=A0A1I1VAM3_9BACT|nr:SO2930 family diheme c-type cytochrome [Nannocystis exedens]PCC72315.1 hypothetical protein NAEX_05395 [Nannocystis exedens]SFD77480.1 conserved hypothetical protein, HNE_0200 family [Nannocystis exedens]
MRGHVLTALLVVAAAGCGDAGGAATEAASGTDTTTGTGGPGTDASTGDTTAPTTGDPCAGTTRCPAEGPWPLPKLSDYDFFVQPMVELAPKDGVVPYTVAAPLWSDAAGKGRFIVLPEGEKIGFTEGEGWSFPDGAVIIKNFWFDHDRRDPAAGRRMIETRLLYREAGAWESVTYLWDDAQTEATLHKIGERVDVAFIDEDGQARVEEYIVPNLDQCGSCHERDDATELLGTITHQLNTEIVVDGQTVNQLEWLAAQDMFSGTLPDVQALPRLVDPFGGEPLDTRARSYLHANCSHCHRLGGGAGKSGLVFLAWEETEAKLGVCKVPAAAGPGTGGHHYDIVPGKPDDSIVIFRMNSLDPEIKMPELPNRVIDQRGVQLIHDWIAAMPEKDCEMLP